MDDQVKEYINKQEEHHKALLLEARKQITDTIPNCVEGFKWGVPVYDHGRFYVAAMKTRVHIGFAIVGLSEQEIKNFEGSGKTMRHLKIHSLEDLIDPKVKQLIELVHHKAECPPDYK